MLREKMEHRVDSGENGSDSRATETGWRRGKSKQPIHINLQEIEVEPSDGEDDTVILDSGAYFKRLASSARPSSASSSGGAAASVASSEHDSNGRYKQLGSHADQSFSRPRTASYEEIMKSQNQENDPENQFYRHRYGTIKALQHQHRRLRQEDNTTGEGSTETDKDVGQFSPVPPSRETGTGVLTPANARKQNTTTLTYEPPETQHNMLFSTFWAPTTGTSRENTKTRIWAYVSTGDGETVGFEAITPAILIQLTGVQDLEVVQKVQLGINTSDVSASALGEYLPNLRSLTLDGSVMSSIRDLGTKLRNLRFLFIANCGVTDLDGICALEALEELHAPYNRVSDAAPLALHDQLQVLDLRNNLIRGVDQLSNLCSCPQLKTLTLQGNPVASNVSYRRLARHFLPNVVTLDGEEYGANDKRPPSVEELAGEDEFSASSDVVTQERLVSSRGSLQTISHEDSVTSSIFDDDRDDTIYAPKVSPRVRSAESGTASSLSKSLPDVSPQRPHTTGNLNISVGNIPSDSNTARERYREDHRSEMQQGESRDASGLTHGTNTVFAGNPVMAMRRRKQSSEETSKSSSTSVLAVLDELRLEDTHNKQKRRISSRETSRSGTSKTGDPTTSAAGENCAHESCSGNSKCTHARELDDSTLVKMLQQKPKDVPQLKSREAFRQFFKGLSKSHVSRLLREAFAPLGTEEMKKKEEKRLELLAPVLHDA
eukprot:gb/GECG01013738.1/.p1 GENE.gb/GECG01013738.1/~~gb/GECG01013738.1/.p1  ORF type:complete len:717 (+),score=92.06 gb/GECG01013738.1/:1-2151(+)